MKLLLALLCLVALSVRGADIKISNLPETTTFTTSDVLPIVHGGATKKIAAGNLLTNLASNASLVFTNISGVIQPSPGQVTNTFQFVSGLADASTNQSVVIDNAVPWTGGKPLRIKNAGVETLYFRNFSAAGSAWKITRTNALGDYAEFSVAVDGGIGATLIDGFNSSDNFTLDESMMELQYSSSTRRLRIGGTSDGYTNYYHGDLLSTGASWDNNSIVAATIAPFADATTTPYRFGTSIPHSSGNLQEWGNDDAANITNKVWITWDGELHAKDFVMEASALKTSTTAGHSGAFAAYDEDDLTYRTFATLQNGTVPSLVITPPSGGTVTLDATTFKAGGSSGITQTNILGIPGVLTNTTIIKAGLIISSVTVP